jgi:hypothetical protein
MLCVYDIRQKAAIASILLAKKMQLLMATTHHIYMMCEKRIYKSSISCKNEKYIFTMNAPATSLVCKDHWYIVNHVHTLHFYNEYDSSIQRMISIQNLQQVMHVDDRVICAAVDVKDAQRLVGIGEREEG